MSTLIELIDQEDDGLSVPDEVVHKKFQSKRAEFINESQVDLRSESSDSLLVVRFTMARSFWIFPVVEVHAWSKSAGIGPPMVKLGKISKDLALKLIDIGDANIALTTVLSKAG